MSSKVVLLKYLPRIHDPAAPEAVGPEGSSPGSATGRTAIVLQRGRDGYLSIQGYPPVHHSDKHKAWSIFTVFRSSR